MRWLFALLAVAATLPFLPPADQTGRGVSIAEREKKNQEARERASGEQRPGQVPPEAIQGSRSGSTIGRAENPWGTKGRPLRGDELQ